MDSITPARVSTREGVWGNVVIVRRHAVVTVVQARALEIAGGRAVGKLDAGLLGQAALAEGLRPLRTQHSKRLSKARTCNSLKTTRTMETPLKVL